MNLNEEDVKLFYKIDWALLFYANQKYGVVKGVSKPDFKGTDVSEIYKLKERIFSKPEIIESFCAENPANLNEEELAIVRGWKNFVSGDFFIYDHADDYSIFLEPGDKPKAYGVVGIMSPIQEVVGPMLPTLVKTVLLPFKGRIIYDGVISSTRIIFGGGMKRTVKEDYLRAKAEHGIITSLDGSAVENPANSEELMLHYMKNVKTNPWYEDRLAALLKEKPELENAYDLELAKKAARTYRKNLKHSGLRTCWLAIYCSTVIASGDSEKEALARAKNLVPEGRDGRIYVFKHEGGE